MAVNEKLTSSENFFITGVIAQEYKASKDALKRASKPPRKKVYKNMNKMLQECFLVGSLKYGNNFIA